MTTTTAKFETGKTYFTAWSEETGRPHMIRYTIEKRTAKTVIIRSTTRSRRCKIGYADIFDSEVIKVSYGTYVYAKDIYGEEAQAKQNATDDAWDEMDRQIRERAAELKAIEAERNEILSTPTVANEAFEIAINAEIDNAAKAQAAEVEANVNPVTIKEEITMKTIETKTVANVNEIVDIVNKLNYKGETFEYENTSTFDDNSKGRFFGSVRKDGNPGGFSILEFVVDGELKAVRFFNHYKDITVEFKLGDFAPSYDRFDNVIEIPADQPANITAAETDGSEDDTDEDIFNLLPTLDELNDVNISKSAYFDGRDALGYIFKMTVAINKSFDGTRPWTIESADGNITIEGRTWQDYAKVLVTETDGSEDDAEDDNPFDFLPDLDELNDVNDVEPVIQPLRQTFIVKPDGNEFCQIFTDNDVVTYLNGEFKDVFSTKYAACYFGEHYKLRYRWYTPNKYGVICANEEHTDNAEKFFAEMERRGACSFDTPDDDNLDNPDNNPPDDIMKKYKDVCWIIKHRIAKNGRHMWFAHTGIIGKAEAAERLNKWGLTIEQYLAAEEQEKAQWAIERELHLEAYRHARHIEDKINRECKPIDNEDAFAFLPTLDELNDVNEDVTVKELFFHEQGTIYNIIIVGQDRVWFKDGKLIRIHSYKYDAEFDNRTKKYSAAIVENGNFKPKTFNTEEEFFAEMERRGACSFDTPEDKTALADSLTRAMKIALENFQAFCRAKNLTAAANEMKLYNICRKALSELWRR